MNDIGKPIRFSNVQVKNWKNFAFCDVAIGRRAFLVGPNAAGKSNLLDVFRFLRDLASATVQAGARAFSERGCMNCHGGPGVNWAKFSEGLRPDPPDLKDLADEISPFKNGINMTGMPSFGAIEVPDREIWTIVAFVKKLPSVSDDDFKAWTAKP